MRRTIDRLAKRMSLTIIIAALLISSSVVVLARVPPFVGNIPLIGFIGYMISIILSLLLIISVLSR